MVEEILTPTTLFSEDEVPVVAIEDLARDASLKCLSTVLALIDQDTFNCLDAEVLKNAATDASRLNSQLPKAQSICKRECAMNNMGRCLVADGGLFVSGSSVFIQTTLEERRNFIGVNSYPDGVLVECPAIDLESDGSDEIGPAEVFEHIFLVATDSKKKVKTDKYEKAKVRHFRGTKRRLRYRNGKEPQDCQLELVGKPDDLKVAV